MSTIEKLVGFASSSAFVTMVVSTAFLPAYVIEIEIDQQEQQAQRAPTVVEIISSVAQAKEIKPEHLLGIAAQESSFGKFVVGDEGCSVGLFHINTCANPDVKDIIGNLLLETEWVANRLLDFGYHQDIRKAIARYNRPVNPNWKYADLVEKRIGEIEKFIGN